MTGAAPVEAWALVESGSVVDGSADDGLVPWWSFTKLVVAASALTLVRDGLVRLDDLLPDRPYSLRHLLQHRSGLANYGGLPAYHEAVARGDEPWPISILWDRIEADRLRFAPGQGWSYSNIGYWIVARIVEELTGLGLGAALRSRVLDPLGVASVRLAVRPGDLAGVAMGVATSYHPGWVYHGLLVGSVRDAALLLDRLMGGALLPGNLLHEMTLRFSLPGPVHGRPWTAPNYGLGLMLGETPYGPVAGHTGGGPGSTLAVYHGLTGGLRTAAAFRTEEDQGRTEEMALALLDR